MKLVNKVLCGALALVASATVSHAQTYVYFNGSTAFRVAAVQAIHGLFDSGVYFGYQGTTEYGANDNIYSGTINSVPYIIKASWTGSESGLQCIGIDGTGLAINFVKDVPTISGTPTALTTAGLSGLDDATKTSGSDSRYTLQIPDVSFSDVYQASSAFATGTNTIRYASGTRHSMPTLTPASTGTNGVQLGDGIVGIIPFTWVASRHADFTNIDDPTILNLYETKAGVLPRSFLSGNALDRTPVYATGRNPDSGTRLNAFANAGLGVKATVTQYEPLVGSAQAGGVNSALTVIEPWPVDTVNQISVSAGNSGFSSGGTLAKTIGSETSGMVSTTDTVTGTGGDLVTYLGISDDLTALSGSAINLSFNGVPYSLTAIENGQYKFWGYEHVYVNPVDVTNSTPAVTIAGLVATSIHDGSPALANGTSGAPVSDVLSNMTVTRSGSVKDGQPIIPNYNY